MWIIAAAILIALVVAYPLALRRSWREFEETVKPPDDLRRADDGYRFPDNNSTGGWV